MNGKKYNSIFEELKKRKVDQQTIVRSRDLLVAYMKEHPHRQATEDFFGIFKQAAFRLRFAAVAFAVLFLAVFAGASTYAFAQEALPGDALYSVKLFTERMDLRAASDPVKRTALRRELFERRTRELERTVGLFDGTKGTKKNRDRLDKGVSAALEDAKGQAEELERDAGRWDKSGRTSDFYRTSERLRTNAMILEKVLSDEKLKQGRTGDESENVLRQTKRLMERIDQELKQPQDSKNEAAKAVLEAAAGSIKDAEGKISGGVVGSERRKGAERNIEKAKDLLKEAKNDYEANDLEKTYEKALKSVRQSTLTGRMLEGASGNSEMFKNEAEPEKKAGGTSADNGSGGGDNGGSPSPGRTSGTSASDTKLDDANGGGSEGSSGSGGQEGKENRSQNDVRANDSSGRGPN
jgi:hypothetical protein